MSFGNGFRPAASSIVIGQHPGHLPTGVSSVSADLLRIAPCDVPAVHAG